MEPPGAGPRLIFTAGSDGGLLQYLAVKVDVQVEPLSSATGIELKRRLGPAEFELIKALLAERAAHFLNVVGPHWHRPRKSDDYESLDSEPSSHGAMLCQTALSVYIVPPRM